MNLNIAVIDDRVEDIDIVIDMTKRYVQENEGIQINISSFCSGEAFIKQFTANEFHAVILDICMDGMNGIELSRRVRSSDLHAAIIFMSTTTEYVFDTFAATPFGYLIKPFTYEQLAEVLTKAVRYFSAVKKTIVVKIPRSEIVLETDTIFSVISCGHNTEIKISSGSTIRSIDSYNYIQDKLLCQNNFVECNRGILINMDYILTIKNNNIVMQDETQYPIRIRSKKEIAAKVTKHLSKKLKGALYL